MTLPRSLSLVWLFAKILVFVVMSLSMAEIVVVAYQRF